MQAVIRTGGKQYIVSKDQVLEVELTEGTKGKLELETLMTIDGDKVNIGKPLVKDVKVKADVLGEVKGEKIDVLKFKAKKRQKTKTGHRQKYTQIKITSIG
ncbi:MAG TPA: 50S ribosomal protein L21 [Candidatus Nanoarchaeia archaeon]|nr:50S ribosomal protein L21 [Candidatus Nanoarchaeia archaeon]